MPCSFHAVRSWPFHDLGSGCQFTEHPAYPLVAFGGEQWCRFHLPLDALDADDIRKGNWDEDTVEIFNDGVFDHIDKAKTAGESADLTGVAFPGNIVFDRYRGKDSALPPITFAKAKFGGNADFNEVHFGGASWFHEVHFSGGTWFRRAFFGGHAGFYQTRFGAITLFNEAQFSGDSWFEEAEFGGIADFAGAGEDRGADERREAVTLESCPGEVGETVTTGTITVPARATRNEFRWAEFSGALFRGLAIFNNRLFSDTTNFVGATFHRAPTFHNAVLHQSTDFTGAVFLDRRGSAAPAYRTLKLAMEQVRARDEEGMFYALEMESRRRRDDTPWAVWAFSLLYEIGSDYGRSLVRPLLLLVGVTLLFYLVYAALGSEGGRPAYPGAPLRLAMEQVVRPFALLTADYESIAPYSDYTEQVRKILDCAPFITRALGLVQSLLSLGLIALFILALRRRFRMA